MPIARIASTADLPCAVKISTSRSFARISLGFLIFRDIIRPRPKDTSKMDYFGRPDPIAQFAAWILKLHFVGNRRRQLPQDRDPVRVRQLRLGLVTSRFAVA